MLNSKKILLVGCGSEIGSMLVNMNSPSKDGFKIDTVLTKKIGKRNSLKSIYARMIILNPTLIDKIVLDYKKNTIKIKNKVIKFYWGDIKTFKLKNLKKKFDATIIATSKKQISNKILMKKFLKISKYVFGVAESKNLPSLYPNLVSINSRIIQSKPKKVFDDNNRIFALGSCQSNGWQAQLRALIETFDNSKLKYFKMLGIEVDIIHPDTPQGRLGTKSIEPRDQDARNNLRPSFSQVDISMNKLFPNAINTHTVSLRTLVSPPGYQIVRFFFKYQLKNNSKLNKEKIINEIKVFSKKNPNILRYSDDSLGSRAFEMTETAAVTLIDKKYFHFKENLFSDGNNSSGVCEIIMQSYVHNTRGYCRSVLDCIKHILQRKKSTYYFEN